MLSKAGVFSWCAAQIPKARVRARVRARRDQPPNAPHANFHLRHHVDCDEREKTWRGSLGGGGGGSLRRGRLSRRPRFWVDKGQGVKGGFVLGRAGTSKSHGAPPLATIWETMNARVSPSEGGKNTGPYESNCRARGIRAACATVKTRTSTSQNNELMSSSLAPSIFFVVFPAVDRGPLFSEVLLLFGIGIAGGAPSSPEFSCFIPGEAARVSATCASVSTCVAIGRGRVWPGPFVHSENAARRSGARGGVRPGGSGKQKKSAFFRTPVQ